MLEQDCHRKERGGGVLAGGLGAKGKEDWQAHGMAGLSSLSPVGNNHLEEGNGRGGGEDVFKET